LAFMDSETKVEDELVTLRRSDLKRILSLLQKLEGRAASREAS
jgi:hypothetical protein